MLNTVTPLLEVKGLRVLRGCAEVVRGVDLRVFAGTIASIVGRNGAGKSSALAAIGRLIPSRGTVTFGGRRMDALPSHRVVRWGLVHVGRDRGIIDRLTVREHLELGAWTRRDRYAVRTEIASIFDRFPDLGRRASARADDLDAPERLQLGLGRALMAKPKLLLLDEPTAGLPPERVAEVFAICAQLNSQGLAILLAEQYERKALAVSGYVYVMERGIVVKEGVARQMVHESEIERAHLGQYSP